MELGVWSVDLNTVSTEHHCWSQEVRWFELGGNTEHGHMSLEYENTMDRQDTGLVCADEAHTALA